MNKDVKKPTAEATQKPVTGVKKNPVTVINEPYVDESGELKIKETIVNH
jgi:hypothetical protein